MNTFDTSYSGVELPPGQQIDQQVNAIAMSNRLTRAKIKLKRLERLSSIVSGEIKRLEDSIWKHTDSLLLGEDVQSNLDSVALEITQFEERMAVR